MLSCRWKRLSSTSSISMFPPFGRISCLYPLFRGTDSVWVQVKKRVRLGEVARRDSSSERAYSTVWRLEGLQSREEGVQNGGEGEKQVVVPWNSLDTRMVR